ncbi:MAG: hypothetical protein H7172_00545 [Ferruginibacter sp.]|nr:hypothetical protein [Rhodoferax sp.]
MTASNFSFLQAEWPVLFAEAGKAEQAAQTDPRTACFYARRTLALNPYLPLKLFKLGARSLLNFS